MLRITLPSVLSCRRNVHGMMAASSSGDCCYPRLRAVLMLRQHLAYGRAESTCSSRVILFSFIPFLSSRRSRQHGRRRRFVENLANGLAHAAEVVESARRTRARVESPAGRKGISASRRGRWCSGRTAVSGTFVNLSADIFSTQLVASEN